MAEKKIIWSPCEKKKTENRNENFLLNCAVTIITFMRRNISRQIQTSFILSIVLWFSTESYVAIIISALIANWLIHIWWSAFGVNVRSSTRGPLSPEKFLWRRNKWKTHIRTPEAWWCCHGCWTFCWFLENSSSKPTRPKNQLALKKA